jgi:hypothetical protein
VDHADASVDRALDGGSIEDVASTPILATKVESLDLVAGLSSSTPSAVPIRP